MRHQSLARWGALAVMIAVVSLTSGTVLGQSAQAEKPRTKTANAYKAPRTADGQPDLQGVWDFRTLTPLERPKGLEGKQVLSESEAAEFEEAQLANQRDRDNRTPADIVGNYNQLWFDPGKKAQASKRSSLIVDPPDGRIPPLTPDAQTRLDAVAEARRGIGMHVPTPGGWVEDLGTNGLQLRCILGFNSGPPITPGGYNQNVQLFQTPTHVVILNEMNHNARIVPLDGRPHLGADIRQWVGDSRGRWEGDTLVVDTTNFLRETAFAQGRTTSTLHLVERFTRVDADTLSYAFTVEDPSTWTRPWSAEILMLKNDQPIYEYACHEGNYGLYNILAGARAQERAGEAAKKGSK
jgi:hypothetical protein